MADYANPFGGFLSAAGDMFGGMFGGGSGGGISSAFNGTAPSPALFSGGTSGNGTAGDLANLYGQYQGSQQAAATNNQVQGLNAQQQAAISAQLTTMQQQAAQQRADATSAYNSAKESYGTQNAGLQGNIDTMTGNLNALSDPNSAYMQMARQKIERADAAAGRRSQWGERETQLAGTLANYVGQYAPGINNSITSARDEMNKNNSSLAGIYDTMNKSGSLSDVNITNLINAINTAATNANTTGRSAANQATNAQNSLVNSGLSTAGSLIKSLFGGGSNSDAAWQSAMNNYATTNGITGASQAIGATDANLNNGIDNYNFNTPLYDSNWGSYSGGGDYSGYSTGGGSDYYY